MTKPARMTVAQYANHRRVSRAAVYKALTDRRIAREADGTIDPLNADAQWAANTSPASRWSAGWQDIALTDEDLERLLG